MFRLQPQEQPPRPRRQQQQQQQDDGIPAAGVFNNNNHNEYQRPQVPWMKVFIISVMVVFMALLQVTVWSLELYLDQIEHLPGDGGGLSKRTNKKKKPTPTRAMMANEFPTTSAISSSIQNTVKPSRPVSTTELHHSQKLHTTSNTGQSAKSAAQAYWNQVWQSGILEWESAASARSGGGSSSSSSGSESQGSSAIPSIGETGKGIIADSLDLTSSTLVSSWENSFGSTSSSSTTGGSGSSNHNNSSYSTVLSWVSYISSFLWGWNHDNNHLQQKHSSSSSSFPKDTDLVVSTSKSSSSINNSNKTILGLHALYKAASLGHTQAQLKMANALASGFWPFVVIDNENDENQFYPKPAELYGMNNTVAEEWLFDNPSKNPQQAQAMLLWHMAAMQGSVEAAVTLANRLYSEHTTRPTKSTTSTSTNKKDSSSKTAAAAQQSPTTSLYEQQCMERLPYYAAAAHGVMDQLQTSSHSRGYIVPAKDKHVLYQIHLHGATASKLEAENRPDERPEALQFYQVKAADVVQKYLHQLQQQTDSDFDSTTTTTTTTTTTSSSSASNTPAEADVTSASAAYTLARYYHTGIRGAPQNLTAALHYYQAAAHAGHWEAAGQAGLLHLWGIGTPQNVHAAYKLFKLGMPFGYEGCLHRYQQKLKQEQIRQQVQRNKNKKKKSSGSSSSSSSDGSGSGSSGSDGTAGLDTSLLDKNIFLCDEAALNGMGLLRLLGVPMIATVDRTLAVNLFQLARDQGNADAAYNLAMVRLGWKTHFQSMHDLPEYDGEGQTSVVDDAFHELTKTTPTFNTKDSNKNAGGKDKQQQKKPTDKKSRHFPTLQEYQKIVTDLTTAANKNHIQARHRLGMMYEKGVQIPAMATSAATSTAAASSSKSSTSKNAAPSMQQVVSKDCIKATQHYKWIIDSGSPVLNARMRRAYKLYVAGEWTDSLRHYLAVAETGHDLAQLNAAFLLEQGVCLGMTPRDCASAAVRLWKAAAAKGSPEASLRVGDFYYYGRFREVSSGTKTKGSFTSSGVAGPFGWVQYILFPEEFLLPHAINAAKQWSRSIRRGVLHYLGNESNESETIDENRDRRVEEVCSADGAGGNEGTCRMMDEESEEPVDKNNEHSLESDLATAARYYRLAADRNSSPRAHFNLGFMYEWGLGLTQDFPLAKRHYDLAISTSGSNGEAEVPVSLSLMALNFHEYIMKLRMSWEDWFTETKDVEPSVSTGRTPTPTPSSVIDESHGGSGVLVRSDRRTSEGRPVPGPRADNDFTGNPLLDVFIEHLLTWESLLILILTILVSILMQIRAARTQR